MVGQLARDLWLRIIKPQALVQGLALAIEGSRLREETWLPNIGGIVLHLEAKLRFPQLQVQSPFRDSFGFGPVEPVAHVAVAVRGASSSRGTPAGDGEIPGTATGSGVLLTSMASLSHSKGVS